MFHDMFHDMFVHYDMFVRNRPSPERGGPDPPMNLRSDPAKSEVHTLRRARHKEIKVWREWGGQGLELAVSYPLTNHTCEVCKAGEDCKVRFADLGDVVDDVRLGRCGISCGGRVEGRDGEIGWI
jgi:hypothetical protein